MWEQLNNSAGTICVPSVQESAHKMPRISRLGVQCVGFPPPPRLEPVDTILAT